MNKQIIYILLLFVSVEVHSVEYFVKTEDEFNLQLSSLKPGDQIILKNGVWQDVELIFDGLKTSNGKGGEKNNPIVLKAETPGEVLITGESFLKISGYYMEAGGLRFEKIISDGGSIIQFRRSDDNFAYHCRLTQSIIKNNNPEDPNTSYKWVEFYGTHNRIDHCWLSGMNHKGVQLTVWLSKETTPNYHRIDHNYFGDRAKGNGNGFETIRIGTSKKSRLLSKTLIEKNLFERCDGEIEIISNKSDGNLYRNNTFKECDAQLTLRHGRNCLVEGNVFIGSGAEKSSGVRVIDSGHIIRNNYFQELTGTAFYSALSLMNGIPDSAINGYFPSSDCLIEGNVFIHCKESLLLGLQSKKKNTIQIPRNGKVRNNIFITDGSPVVTIGKAELTEFTFEGNKYSGGLIGVPVEKGFEEVSIELKKNPDGTYSHELFPESTGRPLAKSDVGPNWYSE